VQLKLPFAGILIGPPGAGKTNLIIQLIKHIAVFNKIVLMAKELDQPLYRDLLIPACRELEKKTGDRILLASSDLKDLPAPEDFDKKDNNLLIVDDMICEKPKDLVPVEAMWMRGRHKNITRIFCGQSYFETPINIRKYSQIICIKALSDVSDLKNILRHYAISMPIEKAMKLYEDAVDSSSDGDPLNHWLTLDLTNTNPNLRWRKRWTGYTLVEKKK
jgi:hypothetical protein